MEGWIQKKKYIYKRGRGSVGGKGTLLQWGSIPYPGLGFVDSGGWFLLPGFVPAFGVSDDGRASVAIREETPQFTYFGVVDREMGGNGM